MHFWAKFRGRNGLKFNFLDPRGYFRFQVMDMIARGQKSKPKTFAGPKINAHHAKFLNLKNSHEKEKQVLLYMYFICSNMWLAYMGSTTTSLKKYNVTRACSIEMT